MKIIEKSGYQALPWVRYITQSGGRTAMLFRYSLFMYSEKVPSFSHRERNVRKKIFLLFKIRASIYPIVFLLFCFLSFRLPTTE